VLFWAIVLFFFFIFMFGIFCRQVLGGKPGKPDEPIEDGLASYIPTELVYLSFRTVPWAMFTLFRCFTDGCVADDGTPLAVHIGNIYGPVAMFSYMLAFLFVTIGLFNLIMAIFVDNVMESTRQRKQESRGEDRTKLQHRLRQLVMEQFVRKTMSSTETRKVAKETSVALVISSVLERKWWRTTWIARKFLGEVEEFPDEDSDNQENVEDVVITREVFYAWLQEPGMLKLLEELDIAISNRYELFDVLDADLSGELGVDEVVTGLMKLRGPAEKSDAVAALLTVRVVLQLLQSFQEEVHRGFALMGLDLLRDYPLGWDREMFLAEGGVAALEDAGALAMELTETKVARIAEQI